MATHERTLRRGLPRIPGGEPWPPAGILAPEGPQPIPAPAGTAEEPPSAAVAPVSNAGPEAPLSPEVSVDTAAPTASAEPVAAATAPTVASATTSVRRGLPRVAGGEPWPPATEVAASAQPAAAVASPVPSAPQPVTPTVAPATAPEQPAAAPAPPAAHAASASGEVPLRRGLPRTPGGEPWPPEGSVAAVAPVVSANTPNTATVGPAAAAKHGAVTPAAEQAAPPPAVPATDQPAHAPAHGASSAPVVEAATAVAEAPPVAPAPSEPPAPAATPRPAPQAARAQKSPPREPRVIRGRTVGQWVRLAILGVLGLVVLAGIIVLAARGVTTLPGVPEFLEQYPGEYHPAIPVDSGFPWWARWTHFLNFFFIVLIIRSGLLVRHQQQPPAFYTPKRGGKKISIFLWLHTSLDVLWLVNGVVFVVLLFVTGHWVRVVPTSWEVFPNAASAMLQYLTLEWPVENGWVNYNSLQQLMYFVIVFIAAPLAAVTGVRMSEWWPQDAKRLNRLYPAPVARAIHYPVMLFFVLFIIVHVFLVLATGALKNLNHMFAGNDTVSWAGFWWFAAGLVVTAAAVWAARPMLIAPIASLTGRVSNR